MVAMGRSQTGGDRWKADIAYAAVFADTNPMHPFPAASKLQFLVGSELEQICVGQWQIQFRFDKFQINAEGDLEHVDKAGTVHRHNTDADRLSPLFLHHLFGQSIQTIEVEPFCLTLIFDAGDIIRVYSDESPYECGQIYDEDGRITVF